MKDRLSPIRWLSLGLVLVVPTLVGAQDDSDFEEIIVLGAESQSSADFSAADSVTGFGAEDLAALGASDIADLAAFTPNLEIVTSGATTPTFFIRGVGLNDFNPNSTGAVAVFQDDVAINAPAMQLPTLFDIEAVNILRGPQGTGLNRNASAGAIKVYSRKPSGEFGGFLRSDFGDFDYMDFEGAVEAPIYEDLLATRMSFRVSKRDGTMLNRCAGAPPYEDRVPSSLPNLTAPPASICGEVVPTGFALPSFDPRVSHVPPGLDKYVNNVDNWAARGTILFQPTLDMSWFLNGHGSRRNEISRLGQSIGTSGSFCDPSLDFASCVRFPFAGRSNGILGGSQAASNANTSPNNGYVPREIRKLYEDEGAGCVLSNTCTRLSLPEQALVNQAKVEIADDLAKNLDPRPWEGDFDHTGPTTNDTWGTYLNGEIVLPLGMQLSTTTAYDTYDRLTDIDLDFSPQTLFHIKTDDEGYQIYQTLRLEGQIDRFASKSRSPLRYDVGGYFLNERLDVRVDNDFGELTATSVAGVKAREYQQNLYSAGGYVSLAFDFAENFTLDGGVRFNWEQKDLDMLIDGGVSVEPEGCVRSAVGEELLGCKLKNAWSAPTGTVRLTYRFRDDTHAFWTYTRGWKPGTYNATASQFTGPGVAKPESLDSFETGVRGSWFEGRVDLGVSFFYYAYENYQIFTARQLSGGPPEFVILNANDAEVYGSELDGTGRPWQGAFVNLRFSWLQSQFLDFVQRDQFLKAGGGQGAPIEFRERQASGNQLLNSPRFKVSLTGEQSVPIGRYGSLAARYDGAWVDTTFFDATEGTGVGDEFGNKFLPKDTIAQRPYWLHNIRLSWRSPDGRTEVAGWVRNITNQAYKTFAFDGSNFQATTIYFVGDPRTWGVSLSYNF